MAGLGSTIGSISLDEKLGEGGMGTVYLGFDHKLERQVAVKAVRSEHRMDSQARTRLLREARILSQLEHPNICRIYDLVEAGGEDFIVLELVRGDSLRDLITDGLARERALELAAQIADALVAAHGLSVVHRDLKPENIVVTPEGDIKVLDFGIARADPTATVEGAPEEPAVPAQEAPADLTCVGDVLGTPRYMSPEQARGEVATAASDIYSFGLVLQELLTGEPPYGPTETLTSIRHRAMWGDLTVARHLGPQLGGLIEAMTAFRPQDRPSAVRVAERLQWMRDRPKRVFRRLAVATIAAAVTVAAVVSTIGFVTTRRALGRAEASEREARRAQSEAEAVSEFLEGMLASADPGREGREVRVVEVLDRAAREAQSTLAEHPAVQAAVLHTLGNTYWTLGLYAQALPLVEDAVELRRAHLGDSHPDTLISVDRKAALLDGLGETERAAAIQKEAVDAALENLDQDDPLTLTLLSDYGVMLQRLARYDEAEPILRRALEGKRRVLGAEHPYTLNAEESLAFLMSRRGHYAEAVALLRSNVEVRRRVTGADHPETLRTQSNLAFLLGRRLGRYDEALEILDEIIDVERRVLGPEHPATLRALENRAETLKRAGDHDRAETALRELLAIRRRVLGEDHPETLNNVVELARTLVLRGDLAQAETMLRAGVAGLQRVRGGDHPDTLAASGSLGTLLLQRGEYTEAESLIRRAAETRRRVQGERHPQTLAAKNWLGLALLEQGRTAEAVDLLEKTMQDCERTLGPTHPTTARSIAVLGHALRKAGEVEEAERLLRRALEAASATGGLPEPSVQELRAELAGVLRASGREEEAAALENEGQPRADLPRTNREGDAR